jgi:hypothetical protein
MKDNRNYLDESSTPFCHVVNYALLWVCSLFSSDCHALGQRENRPFLAATTSTSSPLLPRSWLRTSVGFRLFQSTYNTKFRRLLHLSKQKKRISPRTTLLEVTRAGEKDPLCICHPSVLQEKPIPEQQKMQIGIHESLVFLKLKLCT